MVEHSLQQAPESGFKAIARQARRSAAGAPSGFAAHRTASQLCLNISMISRLCLSVS
jgi:hypothetical protein